MADVSGGVAEDLSKFIPNVCTNSPVPGIETIPNRSPPTVLT